MPSIEWLDTSQQAQTTAPAPQTVSPWLGIPRAAVRGMTFGWGDEAGLGLAALLASLTEGVPFKQAYSDMRQAYNQEEAAFKAQRPGVDAAAEIVGSIASALAIPYSTGFGKFLQAHPYLGGIVGGATLGGIYGAGTANDLENTAASAAQQALTGGAMGLGFPVVGKIGSVVGKGATAVGRKFLPPEKQALIHIREALMRDQITPAKAASRLRQLGDQAVVADLGNGNVASLAEAAATVPGKAKAMATRLHETRMQGRTARLEEDLRNITKTGQKYYATVKEVINNRKVQAKPLYEAARKDRVPTDVIAELDLNLKTAAAKYSNTPISSTLERARRMLYNADGSPKTTVEQLDAVKKAWDRMINIELQRQGKPGKGASAVLPELGQAKDDLLFFMDQVSPRYAAARAIWADESAVLDALNKGHKILSTSAEESADLIKHMSKAELDAYRIGAVSAIRDKIAAGMRNPSELLRERMRPLFETERDYLAFMRAIAREKKFAELGNLLHGSRTAQRYFAVEDLTEASSMLSNLARQDSTGSVVQAVQNVFRRRKELPEPVRDKLGEYLFDPKKAPEVLKILRKRGMSEENIRKLLAEAQSAATSAAVVTGAQ